MGLKAKIIYIMKKTYLFLMQTVLVLSLFFAMGCDDDDEGGGLQVGQAYQGGIIAYVDATGKHGLIAAPEDQSAGIKWSNGSYVVTGATGIIIGTGRANTDDIVLAQGEGDYAAKLCSDLVIEVHDDSDLVIEEYDDWYLPSLYELDILFRNRGAIGGFSGYYYWSSSEYNDNSAWYQNFTNGNRYSDGGIENDKDRLYSVRAIRAF